MAISATQLDDLKTLGQETDADLATPWSFAGETLYIKAHGSGRQWRWCACGRSAKVTGYP